MPSDENQERDLRRQMREGRTPHIESVRIAYQQFYVANKGLTRKIEELREQVAMMESEFVAKGKQVRTSSRQTSSLREKRESTKGIIPMFQALSDQAKAVSSLIDSQTPALVKQDEPVDKLYAAYHKALVEYRKYMASWQDRLPASDLTDRTLELALDAVEKSLR